MEVKSRFGKLLQIEWRHLFLKIERILNEKTFFIKDKITLIK